MAFPVISTYRVQMRGRSNGFGFTFADAENLLDYLDDLGVSHLYLSPILTAVGGSTHGYDVTDPTTVSPELGGSDGLARLSAAARSRGMGLIVDIVPSHVGVGKPEQNAWWWDVLKFGRSSAYAEFFDIDWELGDGRIILPLLGSDSDVANLRVDGDLLRLGDLALPVAPGSRDGTGPLCTTASTIGWSDGGTGCAATAVSSRSPRWPACARKTALCSTPATQRSLAGSPKDSSTACASTTSTDYPIPADTWPSCANCSARTPGSWSKNPGGRRGVRAHAASGRLHRL